MQRNIKIQPLRNKSLDIIPLLVDISNGNFFKDANKPTVGEMISLVSQYTGEPFGDISKWTFASLADVVAKIIHQFNTYEVKEPPREILGCQLVTEPHKQSAGWWYHFEQITAHTDPVSFLGLVYIEKGGEYAMTDSSGNITNPVSERGKKIADKFNAAMFLDLMGFFLSKYEGALMLTLINKSPKMKIRMIKGLNPLNGKPLSTPSRNSTE